MERIKPVVDAVVGFGRKVLSSESGVVNPRRALLVAWTAGTLVAVSVFVGAPGKAAADLCIAKEYDMPNCQPSVCSTYCLVYHDCTMSNCQGAYNGKCYCYDYVK